MANKKDRLTNELSKYVGLGQWAKAVQTLQSLIHLEPTNTHYYLRMGDYSLKAGNKPAAIKSYYEVSQYRIRRHRLRSVILSSSNAEDRLKRERGIRAGDRE